MVADYHESCLHVFWAAAISLNIVSHYSAKPNTATASHVLQDEKLLDFFLKSVTISWKIYFGSRWPSPRQFSNRCRTTPLPSPHYDLEKCSSIALHHVAGNVDSSPRSWPAHLGNHLALCYLPVNRVFSNRVT